MSEDKKDKTDITRIEDLSDFLHEEDEGFEEIDEGVDAQENPSESLEDNFSDAKTDPDIQLPEEFTQDSQEQDYDFASMENDEFTSPDFTQSQFHAEEVAEESANEEDDDFPEFPQEDNEDFSVSEDFESTEEEFPAVEEQNALADEESFEATEDIFDKEEIDEEPSIEQEANFEKTPIERPKLEERKAPETFRELQQFAKNISYGNLASQGNPPYSIILKDLKYKEDALDIVSLLKEFQIIKGESEEKAALDSLERGTMLIPRLGEYSAITICHKLRRFDLNILMGLTEEINPPKAYDSDDAGLVSKYSVYNSKSSHYDLEKDEVNPSNILSSTTSYLEGYEILEYLGIASESAVIESNLLAESGGLEDELISRLPDFQQDKHYTDQIERENEYASQSLPPKLDENEQTMVFDRNKTTLKDINRDLLNKLKSQAHELKGNALVGVSFHVAPMGNSITESVKAKYQVICSASVVWANKN